MFKIFSLEKRLIPAVESQLLMLRSAVEEQLISLRSETTRVIDGMSKDIAVKAKQIDILDADLNKRLRKIEFLFAEELEAKDKARDAAVKAKMREDR